MRDLKIFAKTVEDKAREQIETLLLQPAFANCKVRIMPDVHAGAGCVIGFTANLGDKVIPNVVGVDIGCGMLTVGFGNIQIDLKKLDGVIHEAVPAGRNVHNHACRYLPIEDLICFNKLRDVERLHASLGTLGGGNHFIEVDEGFEGRKFLVIHTGSRNLGKQVADIYQEMAVKNLHSHTDVRSEIIKTYKEQGREKEISEALAKLKTKPVVPKELCYLEAQDREAYLHDMRICQEFARTNREKIAATICAQMGLAPVSKFHTVHNYIDNEGMVRKGAISAKKDEMVLIPINMRDGSIVGFGLGNSDWNCSAPHGAGRIMSRAKAKENISLKEYSESMVGIYSSCISTETLDEAPQAYKSMNEIMDLIGETVSVLGVIRPIYNFKASE